VKRRGSGETSSEFNRVTSKAESTAKPPAPAEPDVERFRPSARPDAGRMTPSSGTETTRVRTLTDSRGRTFNVSLYRVPHSGTAGGKLSTSPGTVLRFVSGSIVMDLADWPDDWDRYTDSQLMGLLDRAQLADDDSVSDSLPLRRQTDLPG
jgi:hypothetical protein